MKRDIVITFALFAVLILLFLGSVFKASAGQGNGQGNGNGNGQGNGNSGGNGHGNGNGQGASAKRAEISHFHIREQRKRQSGTVTTNEVWDTVRTFQLMFDLPSRSQKQKHKSTLLNSP